MDVSLFFRLRSPIKWERKGIVVGEPWRNFSSLPNDWFARSLEAIDFTKEIFENEFLNSIEALKGSVSRKELFEMEWDDYERIISYCQEYYEKLKSNS